tara:strand:- start:659 stop:865 length:207 start_codon:yes stop_codon:yes gene_type:complete
MSDPKPPALSNLVRPERSIENYSRGWELVQTINNLSKGESHPHCDWIMEEFDLDTIDWHYWRRIAESV